MQSKIIITLNENKILTYYEDQLVLEFEFYPDNSVIKHIAFLDNFSLSNPDFLLCEAALRKALQFIYENEQVKKIELLISQQR